ncbi:SDR family NAD(P)-dependent oxidoreductase, partial [Klebsiella pneumoniae]
MLRGKRAVITGGGTGFGQALSVWLAREGVEVDFCARRADDIQKTCSIITAEGGMAKGHLCDCKRTARAVLTGMCYSAGSAMRHGSSS